MHRTLVHYVPLRRRQSGNVSAMELYDMYMDTGCINEFRTYQKRFMRGEDLL